MGVSAGTGASQGCSWLTLVRSPRSPRQFHNPTWLTLALKRNTQRMCRSRQFREWFRSGLGIVTVFSRKCLTVNSELPIRRKPMASLRSAAGLVFGRLERSNLPPAERRGARGFGRFFIPRVNVSVVSGWTLLEGSESSFELCRRRPRGLGLGPWDWMVWRQLGHRVLCCLTIASEGRETWAALSLREGQDCRDYCWLMG